MMATWLDRKGQALHATINIEYLEGQQGDLKQVQLNVCKEVR
jgi:hypothetical protein